MSIQRFAILLCTWGLLTAVTTHAYSQNLAVIDKTDNSFYVHQDKFEDHLIFGYEEPSTESKKLIVFSSFTTDVEGNPHNCSLGSYYDTSECNIKFVSREDELSKITIP